jgi:uncharacterized protein (TIGR03000 family)
MRKWRKYLFGAPLVLLSLLGTDLPQCRAQLEFNGGYVQTHREDHGEVPRLADIQRGPRSPVNRPPSYSPDLDLYYQPLFGFRSYYYTGGRVRRSSEQLAAADSSRAATLPFQTIAAERPETAVLIVHVPENAVLWVEGTRTRSTGRTRFFLSPPLTPGQKYRYRVRAAWIEHGQWVNQTQNVPVQAGAIQTIDLPSRDVSSK